MAQVRRQVPDAQLVIFGEGDLREPLTRQIRDLGLDKHVVLAGFRDDVHALTRSADLFVMSSVTEGLGSAVLDAMALGLPVVGTRAGGIPEAVEEGVTGLLVPPGRSRGPGRGHRADAERPGGAPADGRRPAGPGSRPSSASIAWSKARWRRIATCWRGIQPRRQPASRSAARLPEGIRVHRGDLAVSGQVDGRGAADRGEDRPGRHRRRPAAARRRRARAGRHGPHAPASARPSGPHRRRRHGRWSTDGPWYDPASPPRWPRSPAPARSSSRRPTASSTSCRCSSPPTAPSRRSATTAGGCARTW